MATSGNFLGWCLHLRAVAFALGTGLVVAPVAGYAQDIDPDRSAQFLEILSDHDCRFDNQPSTALMEEVLGAGFDRDELRAIGESLMRAGDAVLEDGVLVAEIGPCYDPVRSKAAAGPKEMADALFKIYQSYAETASNSDGFEELLPFFNYKFQTRAEDAPEEQLNELLADIKQNLVNDSLEIFAVENDSFQAKLILRSYKEDGLIRRTRQASVDFMRDGTEWKLEGPRLPNWVEVEMLPVDLDDPVADTTVGPGAQSIEVPVDITQYALAMDDLRKRDGWNGEMSVFFDPYGDWVAITNRSQQLGRFVSLKTFEELWSGKIWGSSFGLTISHDGRALAVSGEGHGPEIIPVQPHLDYRAPAERNYFARPSLWSATEAVGEETYWRGLAYHPTEAMLTLATSSFFGGYLVFQPVGDGLWRPGERAPAVAWQTADLPTDIRWSPMGTVLAYTPGYAEAGVPFVLRSYPGGEVLHQIERPGYAFIPLLFSPDGKHLITGGYGETESGYTVWDVVSGEEIGSVSDAAMQVYGFLPAGTELFGTGNTAEPVREKGLHDTLYSVSLSGGTPERIMEVFPPHERGLIRAVAGMGFSPNSRFFVAAGRDGELRIWDASPQ